MKKKQSEESISKMRFQQEMVRNPAEAQQIRSSQRFRRFFSSRYTLLFGVFVCVVVGVILFLASVIFRLTNYDIFIMLLFSAILFVILAGVLGVASIIAWIVDISAYRSRLRVQRAKHRFESRRRYWNMQRQRRSVEQSERVPVIPKEGEVADGEQERDDFDQILPKWLIPLLKNRPAALAIHDDLVSTSLTRDEIEMKLQERIDELDSDKVIIRYESDSTDLEEPASTLQTEALRGSPSSPLSETDIEREAILNLLGALELQHSENRITPSFYKRKRKQLQKRLSALSNTPP